jgi:2-hydroxychromene-2-carboxylate isomerase
MSQTPDTAVFYFDLASPYAYLAAHRVDELIPDVVWRPILVGAPHKRQGRVGWGFTDKRVSGMREIKSRARRYGIDPIRWPDPYPANSLTAMRAATYADSYGCGRAFANAAFELAFRHCRDLTLLDPLLDTAAACDIDARALIDAINSKPIKAQLRAQTDLAAALGVVGVPTVARGVVSTGVTG